MPQAAFTLAKGRILHGRKPENRTKLAAGADKKDNLWRPARAGSAEKPYISRLTLCHAAPLLRWQNVRMAVLHYFFISALRVFHSPSVLI